MRIYRSLLGSGASLLAIACSLILAGGAGAGQVTVSPPFNPAASYGYDGWSWGFGGFNMWLGGPGVGGNNVGPPGSYMWAQTERLGSTISLAAVYFSAEYQSDSGRPWAYRMCMPGGNVSTGCAVAHPSNYGNWPATNGGVANRTGGISCNVGRCDAFQLEVSGRHTFGHMFFNGTAVTLADNTAPGINPYYNDNALASGNWLRGSVGGAIHTYDYDGVGVRSSVLKIDGQPNQSTTYSCPNWNSWTPCGPSQVWSPSFDTTSVGDGPHYLVYETTDAASTTGTSASVPFKVDNTAPSTPADFEIDGDGLRGWSTTNSFAAGWTNGGEVNETSTRSGLAKVRIDLEPTDPGSQIDPAPVEIPIGGTVAGVSASSDRLTGLTVPAQGMWTLRLQLVDRAGNASPSGGSEATIGWSESLPPKTLARANGWLSRDDLIAGLKQQVWSKPQTVIGKAPVCGYGVAVSGRPDDAGPAVITVHEPARSWAFPRTLTEGRHWVHIRTIDCALKAADVTEHVSVDVDLTDPQPSFSGVEEGRWYREGRAVRLMGRDALSGMVGADPEKPVQAGAYIAWSINGLGPAPDQSPRGGEATISAVGEGAKELVFAPVDLAGNRATATSVRFGVDASAPTGHLLAGDPKRPTLIRALLSDELSGLEGAQISVRPLAGGAWRELPTALAGRSAEQTGAAPSSALAEARFPDTELPRGVYEARLVAHDAAGNPLTSSREASGRPLVLVNPLRAATSLTAAVYRSPQRCRQRRPSRCTRKRAGRIHLLGGRTSIRVGWRRGAFVQGYLTGAGYAPLAARRVAIHTKEPGRAERLAGTAAVAADGSYRFRIRPGVSRRIRVAFAGDELLRASEARAHLFTAAKLRLAVSRARVRSGQRVTFRGRVIAADRTFPRAGKIVTLQFLTAGRWRPAVAIVRTRVDGRFSVPYRFTRLPRGVRARIRFRVFAPAETGFSHASSASRTRIVTVN